MLTKKEVKSLMALEGEVRGLVFILDATYVLKREGKRGLKRLEAKLEKLDCPIDYERTESMNFYPIGLRIISLLAMQEVLNLDEKEVEKMGSLAPKTSLIIRLFLKYFPSVSKVANQAPQMWKKHYTIGELETVKVDEEAKEIILRLKNCDLHPIFCQYLKGYFTTVGRMAVKSEATSVQEIKCSFGGDKYHEFLLTW